MGRVRAKNHIIKEKINREDLTGNDNNKVIPFLIHGDAAFSGQGVVYESL
jgi:2-oxoglutarate dehydrogenase complex dehydrogenase (E1) component-like enzyme